MFSRFARCLAAIVAAVFFAGLALPAESRTKDDEVIQANRELGVSYRPSFIAYNEFQNGGVQDSEHGWIQGFGLKATAVVDALKVSDILLGATYDFNIGSSNHYSLPTQGSGPPDIYKAPFRSNDVQFWVGKGFVPSRKLLLEVEAEAEYREWLRQLPRATYDTREDYTFWAPGLALGGSYNPGSSLVFKAKAGFEYTVSPQNAGGGNPTATIPVPPVNMVLGPHSLWEMGGGTDWAITRALHTYADVSYSVFGFGKSVAYLYDDGMMSHGEPSSITRLTKLDVGLAWGFRDGMKRVRKWK